MRIAWKSSVSRSRSSLRDEALLAVDHRRRARRFVALAHLGPDVVEVVEVAEDVFLGPAARRRADDHAAGEAVLLAELADDAAEAVALLARLDLAGDADVIHGRHEHEEPPGNVACEVRRAPLVPSGSLATWTTISCPSFRSSSIFGCGRSCDRVRAAPSRRRRRRWCSRRFRPRRRPSSVEFVDRVDDVRDVQKPVAFEPDVNERALHAGQHFRDPALVDVADDAAMPLALDENLGDEIFLEDRHHGLVAVGRDDHFLLHSRSSRRGRAGAAGSGMDLESRRSQPFQPLPARY